MTQRAPRSFLILLAVGLVVFFSVGMYLEEWQLAWLQNHPISVNLLSAVIGFCGGFLTIAIVYNWLVDAEWIKVRTTAAMEQWYPLCQDMADAYAAYASHLAASNLANANWAPIDPGHEASRFQAQRRAADQFTSAGLRAKDDLLHFIDIHAPAANQAPGAAALFFGALEDRDDVEIAHQALDRLSRAVQTDVRRRYRAERAKDPNR
ncbi:hypothetical protein [Kutzneria sp. NPDC052558]|uniref:hypothetical protein n=1 Tax=Kutzneria sp. NPDC052558 TaxID=3364121 RepID=UPI0037CB88FF